MPKIRTLHEVHAKLRACRKCPQVCGRAVHGPALETRIMLVGQAPGVHEESLGRPFAYTAGRTLFRWFHEATGASETDVRETVYFTAVARCFPGKNRSGAGDRPPSAEEVANCRDNLEAEVALLKPRLVIAVGRSALEEVLRERGFTKATPLSEVVGRKFRVNFHGHLVDVIALPHPSGISRWPKIEPGKTQLAKALKLMGREFVKYA